MRLHYSIFGAMAIFIVMALSWLPASGREYGGVFYDPEAAMADSLTVSLVTCYPGPEIYELCGHEAIRVRGEGRDSVWNYGVFDFNEPNFIYRFVKGETDYICAGYPFAWFMPEYVKRGSKVVEQDLNLTQDEARKLLGLLQTEALPQNRKYRYNYVKDNCATRILDRIDDTLDVRVVYPDSVGYGTFRKEMRAYHDGYPWYQFGIDLALGSGIDYALDGREEMFVPVEMMKKAGGAHLSDDRGLVRQTRVLNDGSERAVLPPTSWWLSPMAVSVVILLLAIALCIYDYCRKKITRWAFSLWFIILGLTGCLSAFLVFVSSHEATSPNALIFWLNPLQLVLGSCLWWRTTRPAALIMAYYDIVAVTCMLVVWPFQHQCGNLAFFPLMGATLIMAVAYAIIAPKTSYKNNGHPARDGVRRGGKGASLSGARNLKRKTKIK